jgi:raffinose/stachyose/melibiose transport system substrate-binding protein
VKKISRALAALTLMGVVAACGATPGADTAKKTATPAATTTATATSGTPAPAATPDISKAGDVTLTVWDQEVRGGQNKEMTQLNAAFQAKYPNVKIKRVAKSFEDLQTTLKLAVSGPKAPDVVEANQGRPIMGSLVKAGLLKPLTSYEQTYGWDSRYSSLLLDLNKFSSDGKDFGSGDLYGLSQMGEIVGVYYNKDKVPTPPTTLDDFEAQLAAAKAAGDVPIQFGNLEKWPGIHEYESVLGQVADKQAVRDFVFAKPGASFDNPEFTAAATLITDWVKKGYFNKGFNGTGYDPATANFTKGKSQFLIAGTWQTATIDEKMGEKAGFMLMPGKDPASPVSLGGESLPFAITSAAKNPDVAAAYIDFITNPDAAKVLVDTDNLPAMKGAPAPTSGLSIQVADAWQKLNAADGVIPYLDYTTPTFYDDISAAIQKLMGGKDSPQQFTAGVQGAYDKWAKSR